MELTLTNTGLYPVEFAFSVKSAANRELFGITPQAGTLEVGGGKAAPTVV